MELVVSGTIAPQWGRTSSLSRFLDNTPHVLSITVISIIIIIIIIVLLSLGSSVIVVARLWTE